MSEHETNAADKNAATYSRNYLHWACDDLFTRAETAEAALAKAEEREKAWDVFFAHARSNRGLTAALDALCEGRRVARDRDTANWAKLQSENEGLRHTVKTRGAEIEDLKAKLQTALAATEAVPESVYEKLYEAVRALEKVNCHDITNWFEWCHSQVVRPHFVSAVRPVLESLRAKPKARELTAEEIGQHYSHGRPADTVGWHNMCPLLRANIVATVNACIAKACDVQPAPVALPSDMEIAQGLRDAWRCATEDYLSPLSSDPNDRNTKGYLAEAAYVRSLLQGHAAPVAPTPAPDSPTSTPSPISDVELAQALYREHESYAHVDLSLCHSAFQAQWRRIAGVAMQMLRSTPAPDRCKQCGELTAPGLRLCFKCETGKECGEYVKPSSDSPNCSVVEDIAQLIYENAMDAPVPWVYYGNSDKQCQARRTADLVRTLMKPEPAAPDRAKVEALAREIFVHTSTMFCGDLEKGAQHSYKAAEDFYAEAARRGE